jgi:hypothetical protein
MNAIMNECFFDDETMAKKERKVTRMYIRHFIK